MSRFYDGILREFPTRVRPANNPSFTNTILNLSGEKIHFIGQLELEDPFGGSKTLSAAGGGDLSFLLISSLIFADAGTTLRIGVQDLAAATHPGQGDGTFDVQKDLIGGTDTLTTGVMNTFAMGSGTKTMAQGDYIAIAFDMVSRAGSDIVRFGSLFGQKGVTWNFPAVVTSLGGAAFSRSGSTPIATIAFDDGSRGWLKGSLMLETTSTIGFNVNTSTADEYGNLVQINVPGYLSGFALSPGYPQSTAAIVEFIVYSDPLGTPVAEHTETFSFVNSAGGAFSNAELNVFLSLPVWLKSGVYGVTVRPTSTASVTVGYYTSDTAAHLDQFGGEGVYAIRRLDNTGAFSDYNGGTVETRRMELAMLMSGGLTNAGRATSQIGI